MARRPEFIPETAGKHATPGPNLASAEDIARHAGVAADTVRHWHARRARTGHPPAVALLGGVRHWDIEEWDQWWNRHRARIRESFTEVDFSGDPYELVGTGEAARILSYSSHRVIAAYLARKPGYFPPPDSREMMSNGRMVRRWQRMTIWEWAAKRGDRYTRVQIK